MSSKGLSLDSIGVEVNVDDSQVVKALDMMLNGADRLVEMVLDKMEMRLIQLIQESIEQVGFVKTGKYKRSWRGRVVGPAKRQVYTTEEKLHILLEYTGADAHTIEAGIYTGKSDKKALKWVDGLGTHFRASVVNSGFRNIPHVRPAVDKLKKETPAMILEVLRQEFGMFGWN